jgi:hypothetical protein
MYKMTKAQPEMRAFIYCPRPIKTMISGPK